MCPIWGIDTINDSVFWVVTVVWYRRFGTTYQSYLQVSSQLRKGFDTDVSGLPIGPIFPPYAAEQPRRRRIHFNSLRSRSVTTLACTENSHVKTCQDTALQEWGLNLGPSKSKQKYSLFCRNKFNLLDQKQWAASIWTRRGSESNAPDRNRTRVVWITLPTSCTDFLEILEASTSWDPQSLTRPVQE